MDDLEMKKKVLQEMMDMMSEKDGDKLKQHPKMMSLKVEEKPLEGSPDEEKSESPSEEASEDDLSPEAIQKLLELYKNMK